MLRINLYLIFSIITFNGCTSRPETEWYQYSKHKSKIENRVIAEKKEKIKSQNSCWINNYNLNSIKQEILEMETDWPTGTIEGRWNGFDLTKFSYPQAYYLSLYGDTIEYIPEMAKCTDIICILNSPYADPTLEPGFRIYHWFLKMKKPIAITSDLPCYKKGSMGKDLKDYLFPKNELEALNIVSNLLSKQYIDLETLKAIYRIPNGYLPAKGSAGRYSYHYYESRITEKTMGEIYLSENSTRLNDSKLEGYFYNIIIHELSHAIDRTLPSETGFFSTTDDWTKLSWNLAEVQNKGKTVQEWQSLSDSKRVEGFVNDYAGTSPGEDFAESSMKFRKEPDEFKSLIPQKFNLISKNIYNGIQFDQDSYLKSKANELVTKFNEKMLNTVFECLASDNSNFNPQFIKIDQNIGIDASLINCIGNKTENMFDTEIASYFYHDYDACFQISSDEKKTEIKNLAAEKINAKLQNFFKKTGSIHNEDKAIISKYMDRVKAQCDPERIYVKMKSDQKNNSEFKNEYQQCLNTLVNGSESQQTTLKQLVQILLDLQPVEEVMNRVNNSFDGNLLGVKPQLKNNAEKLWSDCANSTEQIIPIDQLNLKPFTGNSIYLEDEVLDCINERIEPQIDFEIREFLLPKDANPSTESIQYARARLMPFYLNVLNEKLTSQRDVEANWLEENKPLTIKNIIEKAKLNYAFVSKSPEVSIESSVFNEECMSAAQGDVSSNYADLSSKRNPPVKTININSFRKNWSQEICNELFRYRKELHNKYYVDKIKEKIKPVVETSKTIIEKVKEFTISAYTKIKAWVESWLSK